MTLIRKNKTIGKSFCEKIAFEVIVFLPLINTDDTDQKTIARIAKIAGISPRQAKPGLAGDPGIPPRQAKKRGLLGTPELPKFEKPS
jgi:hypothetical protein